MSFIQLSSQQSINQQMHWKLWQSGLELYSGDILIFKLREILQHNSKSLYRCAANRFKIKQDGLWSDIDLSRSSILEIYFPLQSITFVNELSNAIIPINTQYSTKLLSLCVDHVDILLEDWYPTLGTRFVHTSEGRFLVTRLIPCPKCIEKCNKQQMETNSINGFVSDDAKNECNNLMAENESNKQVSNRSPVIFFLKLLFINYFELNF